MWMNIIQENESLGVDTNCFLYRVILYINKKDHNVWFMQFKTEEAVLNFEKSTLLY